MQLLSMIVVCCLVVVYLAKGLIYLCCSCGVIHACMRWLVYVLSRLDIDAVSR